MDVPENLQRLSTEHRLRISKVEDVVLTRLHPDSLGGLPGLLLTLEGLDSPSVDITNKKVLKHSSSKPSLDLTVAFRQTFVGRQWLHVRDTHDSHTTWFRPILLRDTEERGVQKHPSLEDDQPEPLWERNQELRHTVRGLRIWGPPGVQAFLASFMDLCGRLQRLHIEIHECVPGKITLYRPHPHTLFELNLSMLCLTQKDVEPSPKRHCPAEAFHYDHNHSSIVCMFGRGDKMIGRFLLDKARELGVPAGPLYGQLKNGCAVTLSDGRVIEPAQVCEPSEDAIAYIILNCHTQWEITKLHEEFSLALSNSVSLELGSTAVPTQLSHILTFLGEAPEIYIVDHTPSDIRDTPLYKSLMSELKACKPQAQAGKDWHYIPVLLPESSHLSVCYPYVAAQALNILVEESSPYCQHKPSLPVAERPFEESMTSAGFLDKVYLVPREKWKSDGRAPDVVKAVAERVAKLRSRIAEPSEGCEPPTFESDYPMLQLLGTGAAQPSKYRNVSASVLRLEETKSILLDCGEGTTTQLLWGANSLENAHKVLESIDVIFISHKHADHHMGLLKLLHMRRARGLHTRVIAPSDMKSWLQQIGPDVSFQSCESLIHEAVAVLETGSYKVFFQTLEVMHITRRSGDIMIPHGSFAVKLTLTHIGPGASRKDIVVSFSGDLAPDNLWTDFIKGSDCLLHEATFEDELKMEAVKRLHCTTGDAIDAALTSEIPMLVLTHFSQRYPSIPKIPVINEKELLVCIAFGMDFTTVPLYPLGETDNARRVSHLRVLDKHYSNIKHLLEQLNAALAASDDNPLED